MAAENTWWRSGIIGSTLPDAEGPAPDECDGAALTCCQKGRLHGCNPLPGLYLTGKV